MQTDKQNKTINKCYMPDAGLHNNKWNVALFQKELITSDNCMHTNKFNAVGEVKVEAYLKTSQQYFSR